MFLITAHLISSLLLYCGLVVIGFEQQQYQQGTFSINKPNMQPVWMSPVQSATGSVRCFCNLPVCVSTGYMCKSSSGGCFSDLLHQSSPRSVYEGRHGCLELLTDKGQRDWCKSKPNRNIGHRKKSHPRSLLLCCYRDMCNHADSPETTKVLMNETDNLYNGVDNRVVDNISSPIDSMGYNNSEVWFKAATIAVPICGAVILLVLIALAVRILRSESHSNSRHKLGATYLSTQNKNNCGKFHKHYQTSQNLIRKEPLVPTHQNPVYVNHVEELRQIRTPLLVQNELGNQLFDKNTNVTVKYLPKSDYNHSLVDMKACYSFNVDRKNTNYDYAHSNPELHQKNVNCASESGILDSSNLKTYDKSKLKKDVMASQ